MPSGTGTPGRPPTPHQRHEQNIYGTIMKRTKVYFLVPIVALVLFYAYYWNFMSDYDAKQAAAAAIVKAKRIERLNVEAQMREKAIQEAIEEQKKREKQ